MRPMKQAATKTRKMTSVVNAILSALKFFALAASTQEPHRDLRDLG